MLTEDGDPYAAAALAVLKRELEEEADAAGDDPSDLPQVRQRLAGILAKRARENQALQSQLEEFEAAERSLDAAWDAALEKAAAADPMSFGPRLELQRLVTEEIELTQQEQTLRQEIETLRAQIASARASQVVDAGRSGKQQRRQLDDLEAEYVQKLEALQRVRSAIRQIALGAHRLTFALPGVEKVARQAIIASPDYAAIETAAQELEEQRQATADAIATVFKSQSRNLVEQALAEVRAAERRNAADPSSPMQAVEPPSEETAAGAHEPASFLGPLFRDRGETDTEFELNLQRRVVELKAWASRNQRRAEVSVGAAIVAVALLGVVIITAESRGLLLAAASYVIPGAAALLIMAAQARERRRAATEEITDVENEALRG